MKKRSKVLLKKVTNGVVEHDDIGEAVHSNKKLLSVEAAFNPKNDIAIDVSKGYPNGFMTSLSLPEASECHDFGWSVFNLEIPSCLHP